MTAEYDHFATMPRLSDHAARPQRLSRAGIGS
ncbi:hypothetical protein FNL39_103603 [Nocardia caishijiensis]|uniref:Uncharacterized protein n=1 Tax=Nocardia caishijiensis TaxID=184756 RepID=A0ABQ6YPN1_9NOCA|nr:hypothetical protein FNL39_103603 [Nocardia caishijiensis]